MSAIPINLHYYDLKRNWTRRILPHLADRELNDILVRDFNRFTWGRWRQKFTHGRLPCEFESCDWQFNHRGPVPRFWRYTRHAACHWLTNFSLRLAMLAEPKKPWFIMTAQEHSTVFDGKDTLFDFNFQAMGLPPQQCYVLAQGRWLKPVKRCSTFYAQHFSKE